ncbi:fused response regulator/phosphatase [Thiomicrorhabdus sediminis]|uniref:Fused response regulator/phosphatase n=1 Tax=Thiomicrorhabdus sediminis TaxID=2580412 RepID=A0A4P9K5S1_9GAMM|nr:fused response regulator/phosphatase [Thiomicrorhabdus sediminis]QCU90332.1 fused response regulator/phosphatase [Thiomicrorhabdus sediminis]
MISEQISDAANSHILVIDDEPMNRALLEDIIDERYRVTCLESGRQCLDFIEQCHIEELPDMVLLDINMPEMSGFEVCQQLKASAKASQLPVIFLTALIGTDDERYGLEIGAVDYITKPFTESILLARIQTHLALNEARKIIEVNNQRLQRERNHLEQIIRCMREDNRFVSDNLSQLISPVEASNGDIILSTLNRFNHQHLLVGDFTGHGLNAAVAGPLVSSLFYTQNEQGASALAVLEKINNELYRKLPSQHFLAATFIDWDKHSRNVTVWNFAMPDTVLIKADGSYQKIASMSVALGVLSCEQHSPLPTSIHFNPGDMIFAYSDGIEDVLNPQGERFGEQRLKALLQQVAANELSLESISTEVEQFADGEKIVDDLTIVQLIADYSN